MSKYKQKRQEFYSKYDEFWFDLYGSEYSLYHILPLSEEKLKELRMATEKLGAIFFKTANLLRQLPNEDLIQLGIPELALPYLRCKTIIPETIISRFDFALTQEGFKLLEYNSDTPTFIMECFRMNRIICNHFGYLDPNEQVENILSKTITTAIMDSLNSLQLNKEPNIVFTAHDSHKEDWNTTQYLSKLANVPCQVLPLHKLRIGDDALIDEAGEKIDILYRQTYPLEHLLYDEDAETKEKVGLKLLELVMQGKLAIINPMSSFLLQSKAIQALIWGLAEEKFFFTETERNTIWKYMLPTYLEPDPFISKSSFVKKPAFGREGDTITIFNDQNAIIERNQRQTYDEELPVYQQYVSLPTVELETEQGTEKLSYMFGSFLLSGKASAIGIRAGGKITANESYFLPVGLAHTT